MSIIYSTKHINKRTLETHLKCIIYVGNHSYIVYEVVFMNKRPNLSQLVTVTEVKIQKKKMVKFEISSASKLVYVR